MIESIELINFISHKDTSIQLEDSVNVFIGANGAGKSSVIDAITYVLYGEHTRDSTKNILRRGAAEGSVAVIFGVGSRRYSAERKFGRGGKLEAATLKELSPTPRLIVAGERTQFEESMSEEVAKTFGLDYEKMKVAAIVQQGELDAIIRYKPKELKELLNSLIGIDKLDHAFGNMRGALDGFRQKLRAECMNYDDQSIEALAEEIRSISEKKDESEGQVREASERLSKLEVERDRLQSEIAAMEPLRAKKKESEDRREDLVRYVKDKVSEIVSREKELAEVIAKANTYLPVVASKQDIESEFIGLEEQQGRLREASKELTSDLRSARKAVQEEKKIEEGIRDILRNIEGLDEKIKAREAEISRLKSIKIPTQETMEQLGRRRKLVESSTDDLRDELTKVGEAIGNYERIQKEGICPTCESTVEEINLDAKLAAKHKEHTEAESKFKKASLERDSILELIEKRKEYDGAMERLEEKIEHLREYTDGLKREKVNLASLQIDARAKSAEARNEPTLKKKLEGVESDLLRLEEKKRSLRERQTALTRAESWLSDHEITTDADVTQLGEKLLELREKVRSVPKNLLRAHAKELAIDEFSSQLAAKVASLEREASELDESAYQDASKRLDEEIRPTIRRMTGEIGGWMQMGLEAGRHISKMKEAQARLEEATAYIRLFEKIRSDVYNRDGILATSLRSWALKELSRNASEYIRSFGIGLSELQLKEQKHDLNIECYSGFGLTDVRSMSGGEGVAIALALRFAMARLMGKGMVDFIALDEPTTHLDEERRRSLVRLITEFNSDERRSSLNQIIVITHDKEIFEDSEVNAVFQFQKTGEVTSVTKS